MQTKATVARHPLHPMLVPLPIGLFVAALVFDLLYVGTGRAGWATVAYWDILAGLVGALMAAVPGFVDYLGLRDRARRIGTWHLALNLTVVGLFALNLFARTATGQALVGAGMGVPLALSIVGVTVLLVSGWLGGEMVYVHGVSVQPGAEPGREVPRIGRRAA